METGNARTSNPETRLVVTRKRETRIVSVPVTGFGMVGLGKVGGSMIVVVISCRTVVRLRDPKRVTLSEKGIDCIFVGMLSIPRHIGIYKFKARLVIQGFGRKEGIDYFDTHALIARITTIRLFLALAAIHNLVIHEMDVKTAFLNDQVDKTKKFLSSRFSMKDMGEADVIFGIKIKRENKEIVITQSHYIEKTLRKFNREDCSPVSTPMNPVEKLKPNTGEPVYQLEYSRAIGCLMYAMTSTRPDIAYVVGRLSRFIINPIRQHWKAITRVFKYLRGTKDYGLSYVGYPSVLEGYSDASWINHVEDSSSTSGWVFLLEEVPFHGLPKSKHASMVQTWDMSL
nr:zinc finger, CCHC-type [Tanacetum cinerariifolium]